MRKPTLFRYIGIIIQTSTVSNVVPNQWHLAGYVLANSGPQAASVIHKLQLWDRRDLGQDSKKFVWNAYRTIVKITAMEERTW
jgi:hypothetical protein